MVKHDSFNSLLKSIISHWQQSAKAYQDYMNNSKAFRYAQVLREHNTAVKNLLIENADIIPKEHKEDVESIIEHYTIWTAKWDAHKTKLNPGPDTEFAFENEHRFPKAAAQKMEMALEELL